MPDPDSNESSPSSPNRIRDLLASRDPNPPCQPLSPGQFEFYRKLTQNPLYPSRTDLRKVAHKLVEGGSFDSSA